MSLQRWTSSNNLQKSSYRSILRFSATIRTIYRYTGMVVPIAPPPPTGVRSLRVAGLGDGFALACSNLPIGRLAMPGRSRAPTYRRLSVFIPDTQFYSSGILKDFIVINYWAGGLHHHCVCTQEACVHISEASKSNQSSRPPPATPSSL